MRKLFGTDGIRGRAHEFPLDRSTMFALGESLGHRLRSEETPVPSILIGMDTRESGPEIAQSLIAGIREGGGEAQFVGVVPTPAVAYLCRISDASAGISISASHNPYQDNGVKIFGHDGMKLADSLELQIEGEMMALRRDTTPPIERVELAESPELIESYLSFLVSSFDSDELTGMKVVLDTGYGAAFRVGPEAFGRTGASVIVIHDEPDGTNINEMSGALHPQPLTARVVQEGAAVGVAFDGDADRAIFVDDQGTVRDGDEILYLWAMMLRRKGDLRGDTVVSTVMSNFGFEKQLERERVRLLRAAVGDKYVLEMMMQEGAVIGGEQSGHIIDLRVHTTGDGIHTALEICRLLRAESRAFSELKTFEPMPQILLNEHVARKPPLEELPAYQSAAADAARELEGRGRILVRYSGTENLVRVMVEGEDESQINAIARRLSSVLRDEIAARVS